MDIVQLKEYIVENNCVREILDKIGCHSIKYHSSGYWTCGNRDGDNKQAIVVRNNSYLNCTNYTRNIANNKRDTDLIDLVCYNLDLNICEALKFICNTINVDYYHDFDSDVPESLLITRMIVNMRDNSNSEQDRPLKPIPNIILSYYKSYVNDLFYNDNIDYSTQIEFQIGYDEETNRITIPIFSEIGDLIGVKGRLFKKVLDDGELKYIYIEPCSRSRILYGLHKTIQYIKETGKVYVFESEKAVLQCWSMGYRNCVAIGGKVITSFQMELLVRLGVDIVLCFDKDVQYEEIEEKINMFPNGVSVSYMYDNDKILDEKESPSDNPLKWVKLLKNNIYTNR